MPKTLKLSCFLCLMFISFAILMCACSNADTKQMTAPKNYATSIKCEDVNLFVGQSQKLNIKVETSSLMDYDLGFEFRFENQDVFEIVDNFVFAKNVGTEVLFIRAISGFDENFYENLFVETSITITVSECEISHEVSLFDSSIFVGTSKNCDFENFDDFDKNDLLNLEKIDEKFVIYKIFDQKEQKISALEQNFFFYALIMFDNLAFDWYNFTITCNSNVLSVQKISNLMYVVKAEDFGDGVVTVKSLSQSFEKNFVFRVLDCPLMQVEFCENTSFVIQKGESVDLAPTKVEPSFACPKFDVTILGDENVLEVLGTKIVAKNDGNCFVTISTQNFSKTFVVCVDSTKNIEIVVPISEFLLTTNEVAVVDFVVLNRKPNTSIDIVGDTKDCFVDIMTNSILIGKKDAGRIEFEIVLKNSGNRILAKSEKIVVIFS